MLFRIWNLVIKELIQFRRDRFFAAFTVLAPVLQLALLAQATTRGITEELAVRYYVDSLAEANRLLAEGEATVAVLIPAGFAQDLSDPTRAPEIQVLADGTNHLVGSVALNTAEGAIQNFAYRQRGTTVRVARAPIDLRPSIQFNPALNIQYQAIPAQVGFIVYQVTLALAATALARERELGTLEQLVVIPLSRFELIAGKALPAAILGLFEFSLMLGVMVFGFRVPLRGSLALLLAITSLFILVEIGWGMIISSVSHTQQQAILLVFIAAMTEFSLSGYLVPVKNMPVLLRTLSEFSAIRHYLTALRAIMLKGAGVDALGREILALVGLALVTTAFALLTVHRRLD